MIYSKHVKSNGWFICNALQIAGQAYRYLVKDPDLVFT